MIDVNFKLQCSMGKKLVDVCGIEVHNLTLREIIDFGVDKFIMLVELTNRTKDDFIDKKKYKEDYEEISMARLYTGYDENLRAIFNELIKMLLKKENVYVIYDFDMKDVVLYIQNDKDEMDIKRISDGQFQDFLDGIAYMYYRRKEKSYKEMMAYDDEELDDMCRRIEEAEKKANGGKNKSDLQSIIEGVATRSNRYDLFNIWDLTLYQLMHTYSILIGIDSYDQTMRVLAGGGEFKEKVNINDLHWSNKISES